MRSVLALGICILAIAIPARGAARPSRRPNGDRILTGAMAPTVVKSVQRIALDPARGAHEVTLEIFNNRLRDLDLAVYGTDPEGNPEAKPMCVSQSTGDTELCRFDLKGPAAWIEVTATSAGGIDAGYAVWYRPLKGPAMAGTELYADDAKDLAVGHFESKAFQYEEPSTPTTFKHLYALSTPGVVPGGRVIITLSSRGEKPVPLEMTVFDDKGAVVKTTERGPAAEVPLTLTGPVSAVAAYVLVRVPNPQDIFANPQYLLAAAAKSDVLPVRLGPAGFDAEGSGERHYEIFPEGPTLALITVEGLGTGLSVKDARGRTYPLVKALGGARQSVFVGQPVGSSRHVYSPLSESTSLLVDVRPAPQGGTAYATKWQLSIRGPLSEQYLVDAVNHPPEPAPGNAKRITGNIADGDARTIVVRWASSAAAEQTQRNVNAPRPSFRGNSRISARLMPPSDATFDMAVSNRFGQVINIGSPGVLWTFSSELPEAFLTIFPKPGSPAQKGGPYEVVLSEGTSLAK